VETRAIAIHAIEMLNHGIRIGQIARAVWTSVAKTRPDKPFIFFAIHFNCPTLADPATQFVKTHAY
jgi:hypothetical protein